MIEEVHELDEADRACSACGGALTVMTGQYEQSEEIDVVERRFVLKKHKRKKYHCACGGCVETALGPQAHGGRPVLDHFAIAVAIQKYLDHLPLEHQVRIMAREGLTVDSQTPASRRTGRSGRSPRRTRSSTGIEDSRSANAAKAVASSVRSAASLQARARSR
jgi:transposase